MKALKKYALNMNYRRYAYCFTLLALMGKGYHYKKAKDLVLGSDLLANAEEFGEWWFRDRTWDEQANWVIEWWNHKEVAV